MLFWYRIDGALAVGAPCWRSLVSKVPTGIVLKTSRTFPPNHPTTKMCLRLMLQDAKGRHSQALVDVGCGSGILALAGLKLGVDRAVAVDISPQAVVMSRVNAELNHVKDRLRLVHGCFDLVLANLPMPILTDKLAELVRLSGDKASFVLSGFQDVDKPRVEEAMARAGLSPQDWRSEDLTFSEAPPSGSFTWMAVLARRAGSQKLRPTDS